MNKESVDHLAILLSNLPVPREIPDRMAAMYAKVGFTETMRRTAAALEEQARKGFVPATAIARLYAYARSADKTMEWLEKGFAADDANLAYIGVVQAHDFLWDDPRFLSLLQRLHLPAPPRTS